MKQKTFQNNSFLHTCINCSVLERIKIQDLKKLSPEIRICSIIRKLLRESFVPLAGDTERFLVLILQHDPVLLHRMSAARAAITATTPFTRTKTVRILLSTHNYLIKSQYFWFKIS